MSVKVHAKWVIAGEHTILNGGSAIALPHPEFCMILRKEEDPKNTKNAAHSSILDSETWKSLCAIAQKNGLSESFFHPHHKIYLQSTIPIGGGLGSSAALCVGLLRLAGETEVEKIWRIGREMECHFHGKSSGMDIAAVLHGSPIHFSKKNGAASFHPISCYLSDFAFRFHDTGLRGKTSECIQRAQDSGSDQAPRQMKQAVDLALKSFEHSVRGEPEKARSLLAESFRHSWTAYENWQLLPHSIQTQAQALYAEGALGVRLTGAGMGGFLVSLWSPDPIEPSPRGDS